MASQTLYVGTGADNSGAGSFAWTSPGNITAADGSYASVTLTGSSFTTVKDLTVSLIKGGTISGNNYASSSEWGQSTDSLQTCGGSSDLWGLTLGPSDVNAANFGLAMNCEATGATEISHYLEGTMSGNLFSIPGGSTINGITAGIYRHQYCTVEGTLISTRSGERKIETLAVGDKLLSMDHSGKELEAAILRINLATTMRLLEVCTDRHSLICTPTHPLMLTTGERPAYQVTPGAVVFTRSGPMRIQAIEPIKLEEPAAIYTLTVEAPNTYYANGILSHNKAPAAGQGYVDYYQLQVFYTASTRRRGEMRWF